MQSATATLALFSLVLLPVSITAAWTLWQIVLAERELRAYDGLEGMHFEG